MRDIEALLRRDMKNALNKRLLFMLIFMLLLQVWFIIGSGSAGQVREAGVMNYMAVVFSFNFFGSIIALALNHDGLSVERESKFLDLLLTSGISKRKVYFSKVLTSLFISCIFALGYVLVLALVYLILSGDIGMSLQTLRYILPLTAFLSVFSLMGLMFSVIFRSSRTSLILSILIGGLMMPRLFAMLIDGLSGVFGFSELTTEVLYMLSPALIMNALNGYSETVYVFWGLLLLGVYLTTVILSGICVFTKQDELNYGE